MASSNQATVPARTGMMASVSLAAAEILEIIVAAVQWLASSSAGLVALAVLAGLVVLSILAALAMVFVGMLASLAGIVISLSLLIGVWQGAMSPVATLNGGELLMMTSVFGFWLSSLVVVILVCLVKDSQEGVFNVFPSIARLGRALWTGEEAEWPTLKDIGFDKVAGGVKWWTRMWSAAQALQLLLLWETAKVFRGMHDLVSLQVSVIALAVAAICIAVYKLLEMEERVARKIVVALCWAIGLVFGYVALRGAWAVFGTSIAHVVSEVVNSPLVLVSWAAILLLAAIGWLWARSGRDQRSFGRRFLAVPLVMMLLAGAGMAAVAGGYGLWRLTSSRLGQVTGGDWVTPPMPNPGKPDRAPRLVPPGPGGQADAEIQRVLYPYVFPLHSTHGARLRHLDAQGKEVRSRLVPAGQAVRIHGKAGERVIFTKVTSGYEEGWQWEFVLMPERQGAWDVMNEVFTVAQPGGVIPLIDRRDYLEAVMPDPPPTVEPPPADSFNQRRPEGRREEYHAPELGEVLRS